MTSRGNPSISPPAQITQPRHVNAISSSTPPPQQYIAGPSPALQQGGYEYISQQQAQSQGQPFLPYQAYGSALNDPRGQPGNSGRGGPPQQNLPQGGGYYQQPGQNMRPQQSQQGPTTHQQYYISTQGPAGLRQRPPSSTQQMVFVPPNFQPAGNNVIIPANVYHHQRVPLFQPYAAGPNPQYHGGNVMYFNNVPAWRGGVASAGAPNSRPRTKNILEITDPDTGRNITEELFNRNQASEVEEHHEDAPPINQNDQEICKTFTRLVADRLKSPDDSNPPGPSVDNQGAVGGAPVGSAAAAPSSQYQQPPPPQQVQQQQQQQQHPPPLSSSTMMRPHMSGPPPMPPHTHMLPPRPGMMPQPPPSATPPAEMQHQVLNVNLSMPPPQIPMRPAGTVHMYNPSQQQQQHPAHHGPRHPQPQPVRTQMPVMSAPPQPTHSQPQPQPQQSQQLPPPSQSAPPPAQAASPPSTVADPSQAMKMEPSAPVKQKPQADMSPDNIPAKPTGAPAPVPVTKTPTPPKEESPAPVQQTEPVAEVKPSPAAATPASKETPAPSEVQTTDKTEEPAKEESNQGTSTQGVKDGRKGKKNKKDINRKEIGGTDMDAFIDDKENETVDTDVKPPLPPSATDRKNSQDKAANQDNKSPSTPTPRETSKVTNKEPSPQPSAPSPAPVSAAISQQQEEEKVSPVPKEDKSVAEPAPVPEQPPSTANAPTNNQNQQATEQAGSSIRNNRRLPGQTERQTSQPLDNGVGDDVRGETVPTPPGDTTGDNPKINHQSYNDENEPPKESLPKQRSDEGRKGQQGGDSDGTPTKPAPEKTPLNKTKKEGKDKLQYDRNYLMELRECASSQTKPEGLPNLEIILDRPVVNSNRGSNAAPLDFTPAFFQPQTNQRHAPQIGKTGSRGRQRPDVQMPPRVIKSVSLQNDVKPLHQSEKPWKPTPKQMSAGELADKKKTLESEVLFIMNRLTPTNFERLAGEMRKLNIKAYEDLQQLVNIFFDKVTMETKFVEAYALLCKVMSPLRVAPPAEGNVKENQCTFRVVMLTKCQQEFESDKTIIFEDPEEKKKKIESEMPEGPERDALIENTLYQMKLRRLKFYGNIRFIGELFKLGMLTENIMHDCIYRLLKARDDDSLVSLCNLITTVGQTLDTDKAKTRMDQYFAQMAKIAEERKSRIKFTLKDAIDLRSNNWVPRKEQTGPKKIDEVHKDFQQEQATKQFLQSQPLPPRTETPQPGSRRGSRQRQDDKPNDDGWNTVGSKSIRIDASKMKLSKNVVDENNIQLGPGGGMKQFSMWSRGSFGGAQPSQDSDRPAPAANRFSALRSEEDRRNFQRSPSRGDSGVASRGMRQGPTAGHGRGKIMARSSQEGERRDALASARSIVGGRSQNSSRDNSWNREDRRQPMGPRGSREGENPMTRSDISLRPNTDSLLPPSAGAQPVQGATAAGFDNEPVLKKLKPMSEEEMEHKAKTILEEYLNVRDLEEAKLCLRELAGQAHLHVLVTASINDVLERSNKERELAGEFFHEMVKNNLLSMELFLKGLAEVLQFAEDMVIDIPMIWTYLAQMIVPLLLGGSMPWSQLPTALKPHLEGRCCAKLLAEIILIAKTKTSEADVAQMWQSSGLEWTVFLEAAEVDRFLQDKKLEFTVAPVSGAAASRVTGPQVDLQKVIDDIEQMVKENTSNKEIIAFIDKNVPVDKCEKAFIRALMTAIANASISSAMKANEEVIKARKDVLQNYIKNNPELELQALYAIQALMHRLEHPSGVIVSLFDTLYDEEVISEEAFKQWEKSTDPQELEGKGACSMQLTQFFTWLRENEEPEQSS